MTAAVIRSCPARPPRRTNAAELHPKAADEAAQTDGIFQEVSENPVVAPPVSKTDVRLRTPRHVVARRRKIVSQRKVATVSMRSSSFLAR